MKKFLLSLIAIASLSQSAHAKNYLRPLCNGHAGPCLPGEYDDALYPGATGNGMDPRERVGRAEAPVKELIESPGAIARFVGWYADLLGKSAQDVRDILKRLKRLDFEVHGPSLRSPDGSEVKTGSVGVKSEFYPPSGTPSPTPGTKPGFNLIDGNGVPYFNISPDRPVGELYYAVAKLMNAESWYKPWRNTDGTVHMIHNYGQYCHVPNFELTREIMKIPTVIMVRDPDMSMYQFTGECEYPNKTGYNFGDGLWVKLNAHQYCETGWDWFEATGWPWHTVTDESYRNNGFDKLRNIGPCQR